jgi:hypothetical protein
LVSDGLRTSNPYLSLCFTTRGTGYNIKIPDGNASQKVTPMKRLAEPYGLTMARLAAGGTVIERPSPLHVLKDNTIIAVIEHVHVNIST